MIKKIIIVFSFLEISCAANFQDIAAAQVDALAKVECEQLQKQLKNDPSVGQLAKATCDKVHEQLTNKSVANDTIESKPEIKPEVMVEVKTEPKQHVEAMDNRFLPPNPSKENPYSIPPGDRPKEDLIDPFGIEVVPETIDTAIINTLDKKSKKQETIPIYNQCINRFTHKTNDDIIKMCLKLGYVCGVKENNKRCESMGFILP